MALIDADFLKERIPVALSDARVQALIEDVQATIETRLGAAYATDTTITEVHTRPNGINLYLKRRPGSITSVTEKRGLGDTATEAITDYHMIARNGMLVRTDGPTWGALVTVVYTPADDRPQWREAIVDLCRLRLARMAMAGESVGGEFSYTAPQNWEQQERLIMRRIELRTF